MNTTDPGNDRSNRTHGLSPGSRMRALETILAKSADKDWADRGACRGTGPAIFFPERGESVAEAKETCRGCPVRQECLDYAMVNGERFGVWGGLSVRERRSLRRLRQTKTAA